MVNCAKRNNKNRDICEAVVHYDRKYESKTLKVRSTYISDGYDFDFWKDYPKNKRLISDCYNCKHSLKMMTMKCKRESYEPI